MRVKPAQPGALRSAVFFPYPPAGGCQGRPHSPGAPRAREGGAWPRTHLPRTLVGQGCCPSESPLPPIGQRKVSHARRPAPRPSSRLGHPSHPLRERAVRDPVRPGFLRQRWLPGGRGPNGGRQWSLRGGRTVRAPARRAPGCRRRAASARWECPRAGGAGRWGARPDVLLSPSDSSGRGTAGSALASPVRARR